MSIYHVNLWGSDPSEENDDCHTGDDFATLAEAEECFREPWKTFQRSYYSSCTHTIELDGPDIHLERLNPGFRPEKDLDADWRREQAMQCGMAFGCEGFNDTMGY